RDVELAATDGKVPDSEGDYHSRDFLVVGGAARVSVDYRNPLVAAGVHPRCAVWPGHEAAVGLASDTPFQDRHAVRHVGAFAVWAHRDVAHAVGDLRAVSCGVHIP